MSDYFDLAFNHVLQIEKGYANNPSDRGGATRFGITEAVARRYGYEGDMRDLPVTLARSIYREQYWNPNSLTAVSDLSYPIALELFDTGVNMGISHAGEFLQRSVNLLNQQATLYADIKVDGDIGGRTVGALSACLAKRRGAESVILKMLNSMQGERYIRIAERDQTQETFVLGWFANRVQ